MAADCGRRGTRRTETSLHSERCLGKRTQTKLAELPRHPLGVSRFGTVQSHSWLAAPADPQAGIRMADLSHCADRVRARLPLWMRVLHRHRLLWRFYPLPIQRERGAGDAPAQTAG